MMRICQLHESGPQVSVIGLSLSAPPTASLPLHQLAILAPESEDPAASGESALIETIARAVELGVNLLDSDWITANGHAQEILGRALQRLDRESLVVMSKVGPRLTFKGALTIDNSRANIMNQIHDSLFRLKIARVDLLQVHWPDDTPPEQTARGLADAAAGGLAGWCGVCNYSAEACAALAPHIRPATAQAPLNLLNRKALQDPLPWCRDNGVAFLAADPLMAGLLQGRFDGSEQFTDHDRDQWFTQPAFGKAVEFARRLDQYARGLGATGPCLAVAWVLAQAGVCSVLCPAGTPAEIEALCKAAELQLSAEQLQEIDKLQRECGLL
jgi:aryl-alcohol dehydrogenase-like predicted oxidoreductase